MRVFALALFCSTLLGVSSSHAQGLAEAAKREEERRAKVSQGETKSYSNADLGASVAAGEAETDESEGDESPSAAGTAKARPMPIATGKEGARARTAPSAREGGGPSARGEAYWRGRAEAARQRVAAAEKKVETLEATLRGLGGFVPGPQPGACSEGHVVVGGGITRGSYKVCDENVLRAQQGQRVHAELERAKVELKDARAALQALATEARRAGALPGWIR